MQILLCICQQDNLAFFNRFYSLSCRLDSEERSQPSIKTNDKKDAKKPRSSANVLVAAIDFGTAYSGHAFSPKGFTNDPHRITAHKWSASLLSRKTPTNALFNKDQALVAFGYEAEQEFTKLSEEDQHKEYYFFQKFKMQLYDQGESEEKKVQVLIISC